MKLVFNSKMSNSPFYTGPNVYVDGKNDGWSFSKRSYGFSKFIVTFFIISCIVFLIIL